MKKYMSILALAALVSPALAFAAEEGAASSGNGLVAIATALAIGIAALGGTMGQARVASAGLESIGRNPASADKVFTPMLLALALVESLVILSFVIAFFLLGKV